MRMCNFIPPTKHYSETVKRVLSYINKNLSAGLCVQDICSQLFISKNTLNYNFKNELGKTIEKYIDYTVLEKSRSLLLQKDVSLNEISKKPEFCAHFYFSRKFKEKYGITPSAYRQSNTAIMI